MAHRGSRWSSPFQLFTSVDINGHRLPMSARRSVFAGHPLVVGSFKFPRPASLESNIPMLKNTLPRKSHGLFLTCRASLFAVTGITRAASSSSPGPLSVAPRLSALTTSSETDEARGWIARFKSQSIQRGAVEMSFSRSSGPGGQVRAQLHCFFTELMSDRM